MEAANMLSKKQQPIGYSPVLVCPICKKGVSRKEPHRSAGTGRNYRRYHQSCWESLFID